MAKAKILPVFIPHGGCRHRCVFCDQRAITGRDHLPTAAELEAMLPKELAPDTELAFYGGTFTALPKEIRGAYLRFAEKKLREGAVAAVRVSTHPLYIDEEIVAELREYGVSTVELGIESLDDAVLKAAGRGYTKADVFRAVTLLRRSGLDWGAQLMAGLPGDTEAKCLRSVRELLPYAPAVARIYPVLVLEGTALASLWRRGAYRPLSLEEAVAAAAPMYALFRLAGVKVIRMGLQPTEEIAAGSTALLAGPFHPAFGHLVRCRLKREQIRSLLDRTEGDAFRIIVPKRDLPLVFGDGGGTLAELAGGRRLAAGEGMLPSGTVALAPYPKEEKHRILAMIDEASFLKKYTERDDTTDCI